MREKRRQIAALGLSRSVFLTLLLTFVLLARIPVLAQQTFPGQGNNNQGNNNQGNNNQGNNNGQPGNTPNPESQNLLPADTLRPNYVLGSNDQILIRAPEAEEIDNRPFRIDGDGNINLPLVGHLHVAGMSLQELEADLVKRLREYIREPQVFVTVVQFRSEPVFFVGLFAKPGVYPLQGNRTLVEMLSTVGGIQRDAARRLKITRHEEYGPIPLPEAVVDPEKKISTVEVSVGSLTQNMNPAENILLQPYDEISVGRAELVYVNGEVSRVGGVDLAERETIPIAQVLAQSGGFTREAKKDKVRILRPVEGTSRRFLIEVDVGELLNGKGLDIPLQPGDIVYVPRSYAKQFWSTVQAVALPLLPYIIFSITQ